MIKRIGIDLDNTLADFMSGAVPILKDALGIEPKNLSKSWTIEEAFGLVNQKIESPSTCKWEHLGVDAKDQEKIDSIRHLLYVENRLFSKLPLYEKNTKSFIDSLKYLNYKVYIITARKTHPIIKEDTAMWLAKHDLQVDDIFFTHDKDKLCELMDIPIIIEDERMQITNCLAAGINVIAREQPWNEDIKFAGCVNENHGRYFRVTHWEQMLEIVKQLEGTR